MLVEVNDKGVAHEEYNPHFSPRVCEDKDFSKHHGYCLNCGWRPSHVQERGTEVVVHFERELTEITWPSRG